MYKSLGGVFQASKRRLILHDALLQVLGHDGSIGRLTRQLLQLGGVVGDLLGVPEGGRWM